LNVHATSPLRPVHGRACLLLAALAACRAPEAHVADADREVYRILEDRRATLGSDLGAIHLEPAVDPLRERLLAPDAMQEPITIGLVEALSVAAENSREYQRRKEQLFLTALDLTLARYRFQVQTQGRLGALVAGSGEGAETFEADAGLSFTRLLGSGAQLVGGIGLNLFRSLTTGDSLDPVSSFNLAVTQPLLRGYGKRIVMEPLTQAERDVVYEVRSFERFRRSFAVDVYSRYLRIVQQTDIVANQRANYENLNKIAERNTALAEAGRMSDIEMDQARQQELSSVDQLIQEEQRLEDLLDDFKFFLGLPPQAPVQVVPDALARLAEAEPEELSFEDPEWLSEHALEWRLDQQTALDEVDDAGRRVDIDADALRSALNVFGSASGNSVDGNPLEFSKDSLDWTLGVEMDLAIDRLPERNSYRASLIELNESLRSAEENEDSIRIQVRDGLREAVRTVESWKLQRGAVLLAARRVESAQLNLEAGRAETRDILDAQEALLSAQNSATRALVDQRLAVLNLWLDLEILRLTEAGLEPDPVLLAVLEAPPPEVPQP
jgi:outer membrane protein TolC